MAKKRPTSLTVFGVLHIVFGTLGLLGSLCTAPVALGMNGWLKTLAQTQVNSKDPQQQEAGAFQLRQLEMQESVPYYTAFQLGGLIAGALLSALLIVGGIGLFRVAPWGRTTSLIYAALSIGTQLLQMAYFVLLYAPTVLAFCDREAATAKGAVVVNSVMTARITAYAVSVVPVMGMIYPTIVLLWFLRPSVAAACRAGGVDVTESLDYDDRDRREPIDYDDRRGPPRDNGGGEGIRPR